MGSPQLVRDEDAELEALINDAADSSMKLAINGDRVAAYRKWCEMVALIRQRSPGQVERMERQRGLR